MDSFMNKDQSSMVIGNSIQCTLSNKYWGMLILNTERSSIHSTPPIIRVFTSLFFRYSNLIHH